MRLERDWFHCGRSDAGTNRYSGYGVSSINVIDANSTTSQASKFAVD